MKFGGVDETSDLAYNATNALSGFIVDAGGNYADLTLATPGNSGSLSHAKDFVIAPSVPRIVSMSALNS